MEKYSETIKIRITAKMRQTIQAEAEAHDLKFANIIRAALAEYIYSHKLSEVKE